VEDLVEMLARQGVQTMGEINPAAFEWPVTREEGLAWLAHFVQYRLQDFGKYQDAMAMGEPWLFHSRLSFLLNVKLLHPLEVIRAAEAAWRAEPAKYGLAGVEGFIRQILGWREFVRGVYWARMPEFALENHLGHDRALPSWYWTGKTRMRCLSSAIGQSLRHGYAHHIQRLMVTGNFALLAGVHPDAVDEWYLGIYVDAIEWVEMPNTRGMSQYADGGWVGSKPYVSGGNYLSKMSNYCSSCHYDCKDRTGPRACPFNSLYWEFHHRHRAILEGHPRIGMAYRTWDKMPEATRKAILEKAAQLLAEIETL
jgi:deoxyribodipyrimidine photolyase-related protein